MEWKHKIVIESEGANPKVRNNPIVKSPILNIGDWLGSGWGSTDEPIGWN